MYCVKCGQALPNDAKFCCKCGTMCYNGVHKADESNMRAGMNVSDIMDKSRENEEFYQKTLRTLESQLSEAISSKNKRIAICTSIATFCSFVFLISLFVVAGGTVTAASLSFLLITMAFAIGFFGGAIKLKIFFDNTIRHLETQIERLKRDETKRRCDT